VNLFELLFDFILISVAGLFIAFSPMLIITDLLIVLKSKKPLLHAAVLLISIATPLILLCLLASQFIKPETTISISAVNAKLNIPPFINFLLGWILLAIGFQKFRELKYRPLQQATKLQKPKTPPSKLVPLFIFGFMRTLFSLTNVLAILFVTKLIVSNKLNPLLALFIVLWTLAVGMVPFFAIFYAQKNKRQYLLKLQAVLDARMSSNVKAYAYIGLSVVGGIVALDGFAGLIDKL
jgi:hypothetical protein